MGSVPSVYYTLASCLPLSSHVDFALGSWNDYILIMYSYIFACPRPNRRHVIQHARVAKTESSNCPCHCLFVNVLTYLKKNLNTCMYVLYMICVLNFLQYSSDPPGSETKPLCRMCTSLSRERHDSFPGNHQPITCIPAY